MFLLDSFELKFLAISTKIKVIIVLINLIFDISI
jgi:hypothetical protein